MPDVPVYEDTFDPDDMPKEPEGGYKDAGREPSQEELDASWAAAKAKAAAHGKAQRKS